MLGVSGLMGTATTTSTTNNSRDGAATDAAAVAAAAAAEAARGSGELGGGGGGGGGGETQLPGGFSEEDKGGIEEGERAAGGNRWPRQETLALLKIRSDMDVAFRDSSLKGPLWEQVSRKMAELGYHRNAKKCKEKFENVYKYHKRTRDGRSTKPDGKTYRFFDQLEALENTSSFQLPAPPPPRPPQQAATVAVAATPMQAVSGAEVTVSSTPNIAVSSIAAPTSAPQNFSNLMHSSFPPSQTLLPTPQTTTTVAATNATINASNPPQNNTSSQMNMPSSLWSNSTFSSSSSTSSDEDMERRHKRKRKWKDFFERLMKDVIEKQEELQKKFLDTLEKRERDRMIREEAWRVQEMARINREHDLLVQERSMAAARESALITFLQKMTDQQQQQQQQQQQNPKTPNANNNATQAQIQVPTLSENQLPQAPPPAPVPQPVPEPPPPATTTPVMAPQPIRSVETTPRSDNGGGSENFMGTTSSRWPKAEVEALINLRTSLDNKYQETGPKGPLWEEISGGMRKLGYNRNSKRCKEKWENINKYFKKVKESNKKRPEDSKTCPYFHQLDALYKEKAKGDASYHSGAAYANPGKPEDAMVPIMARPEQQWPLPQVVQQHQQQQQQHESSAMDEHDGDNIDPNDHDDDDDEDDDGDDEDEGSGYEIVTNKPSSVASTVE